MEMNNNIDVLAHRIQAKNWVIEQHKIALQRLGDAIERGDTEVMHDIWNRIKPLAYRAEPE